nr:hypothetical protein [Streptomyces durhamensis]
MSYNDKHNEANSENNEDGENRNRSGNCGTEGDTDDSAVLALRARQQRNFLTTLLVAQGIPMLAHGDESGRSQRGNNNACCQDGPLSWVDRSLAEQDSGLWRMNEDDWARPDAHAVGLYLNGDAITEPDPLGQKVQDDSLLLLFNACAANVDFTLPEAQHAQT